MNRRIDHHIDRVRRVLSQLAVHHVPVYGVEIDANRPRPLVRVGAGPYDWRCTAFGQDDKGCWQELTARLDGVELYRRVRHRAGRASDHFLDVGQMIRVRHRAGRAGA